MIISVDVNEAAWSAAMDRLIEALEDAAADASLAAAEEIQGVTRDELTAVKHSSFSWGGPPGAPPWMVSGDLAASIQADMISPDEAAVGPTAGYGRSGDYARIQELGGDMWGNPYMIFHKAFGSTIVRYEREFVRLFPRPYLGPATDEVVDSGRVTAIYVEHWTIAIEEVAG